MEDGKKSIVNNVSADKVNSNESSPESEAVQTSDESSKHLSKKTESLEAKRNPKKHVDIKRWADTAAAVDGKKTFPLETFSS